MTFIIILIIITAAIAGSAAFFSIYGLAQIFSSSFIPVVVMASSLELGKLVTVSYLYRFWSISSSLMKYYLISTVVILMVITSLGIFGFLSAAYQQNMIPLAQTETRINTMVEQKKELAVFKSEAISRRQEILHIVNAFPSNFATKKAQARKEFKPEMDQISLDVESYTNKLSAITSAIHDLQNSTIQQEAHIGPIIYVAKVLGKSTDTAVAWMILLIMIAFDPLAVALTIGVNIAIRDRTTGSTSIINYKELDTKEAITEALNAMNDRPLTPTERIHKNMLEELLRRKHVIDQVRGASSQ